MKNLIKDLQTRFEIKDIVEQRKEHAYLTVQKNQAIPLITHLRDYEKFTHFVLLTAVDWLENGEFQLTYILNNPFKKLNLAIRVMISRENATMTSAHHLWEQVKTYQRELKEMYGIDFPGSPGVNDQFILEGWDGIPPYRRDFDTKKYSEETFFQRPGRKKYDPSEYMKQKLYNKK